MGVSKSKRLPHYLLGSSCGNFLGALRRYGGCSPSRLLKTLGIFGFTACTSPFRVYESLRHGPQIRRTELHPEPLFLFGHWQSGHSPLHMLFCRDRQFSYLNTLQAAFPWSFACSEWFMRPLMNRLLQGKDRGSDSIRLGVDLPQGSDWPMAAGCGFSAYHTYVFPQKAAEIFRRGILLDDLTQRELSHWKNLYRYLMQKTAYVTGKPRLLIRNASDTGRIPQLLSMFPHAKFVHIKRNPYSILQATNDRWESMCRIWALQKFDLKTLRAHSLDFYAQIMQKYLRDRELIPSGNLAETSYEDLVRDPIGTLQHLYEDLGLTGFNEALPEFQRHLDSDVGSLGGGADGHDSPDREEIKARLGFAFTALGYNPDESPASNAVRT